ncbi:hypothetical protein niasHS_001654 [Heterodera schachtii]|uniref:EGF-like domain-containing protein n=1 Tax=Heterodera schachtii TaxID=97005 RepID=A0ABD2KEK7_HETSC
MTLSNSEHRRPCPKPLDDFYCFNGGKCSVEFEGQRIVNTSLSCRCPQNFHGYRCLHSFDSHIFGFSKVNNGVESKAISTIAVILFLVIVIFIWCLLLHRRSVSSSARTFLSNRQTSASQSRFVQPSVV